MKTSRKERARNEVSRNPDKWSKVPSMRQVLSFVFFASGKQNDYPPIVDNLHLKCTTIGYPPGGTHPDLEGERVRPGPQSRRGTEFKMRRRRAKDRIQVVLIL